MRSKKMSDELQRFLDGEITLEALPTELQAEAAAWETLLEDVRRTAARSAPAWLENRVLSATREAPSSAWRRAVSWFMQPRTVRLAPASALAGLAVVVVAAVLPWIARPAASAAEEIAYVQLFLEAPSASSVAIAGDFNSWEPIELEDMDGDGVWAAHLAVNPGIYEYMFVLDGARWVTDPHAERYSDDGFGNRNAILAILPQGTGT
jgi:hypothetical protein